ncbi:MAG: ABC transporter ATP-binding protein [Clostridia bacterium]|nr:ABC transporter ATP-binding protein [Clostridia bacterium]
MIEIKNLSAGGGASAPVRQIQCKLNNGGVIGVLGERGAGKSTLLALLAGSLLPREGTVRINGFDTRREHERVSSLVGYLPRGYEPDGAMTPMEFLLFAADMHGVVYERALRRVQDLLETVGLLSKRDLLISRLSVGERRMLAVASTLISTPEFVILDTPMSGLGPRDAQRLREWILQMGEDATVIVSAHSLRDLDRVCTRAIILKNGTLVDVCEVAGEEFKKACTEALAKNAPVEREEETPKKKNRWRLLTASTEDVEIIDDGQGGAR